jgi:hypothetical protein
VCEAWERDRAGLEVDEGEETVAMLEVWTVGVESGTIEVGVSFPTSGDRSDADSRGLNV